MMQQQHLDDVLNLMEVGDETDTSEEGTTRKKSTLPKIQDLKVTCDGKFMVSSFISIQRPAHYSMEKTDF